MKYHYYLHVRGLNSIALHIMRLLKTAKGWDEHDDLAIANELGFDSYGCVISEANVMV